MKKEYLIRTFELEDKDDDGKYSTKKDTKVITDDLAGELEKLTNEKTVKVNVEVLRQYADELKVNEDD